MGLTQLLQIRKLDRLFRNLGSLLRFLKRIYRNQNRENGIFSAKVLFWRQKLYLKFRLGTMSWNLKEFFCWLHFEIWFLKIPLYLKIGKNNTWNKDIKKILSNSISVWQAWIFDIIFGSKVALLQKKCHFPYSASCRAYSENWVGYPGFWRAYPIFWFVNGL